MRYDRCSPSRFGDGELAYTIAYRDDGGIVIAFEGTCTHLEALEARRKVAVSRERPLHSASYLLVDCTGADKFDFPGDSVKDVSLVDRDDLRANPGLRIAVAVKGDLEYGLGRMWLAWLGEDTGRARVFRSLAEAGLWLKKTAPRA